MLESVTPKNINSMTVEEVQNLIKEHDPDLPSKKIRMKLANLIYDVLGFDMSNDVLYCLASEPKYQMIIATAGSGKTTLSQAKVVLEKIIRSKKLDRPLYGRRILSVVYNEHNVKPMKAKHAWMVRRLYNSGIQGINIDEDLFACTMHSFCYRWKDEYEIQCGLSGFSLLTETASAEMIRTSFTGISKKFDIKDTPNFKTLQSMYNYSKECMLEITDEKIRNQFPSIKLTNEQLTMLFTFYDAMKKNKKKYDFVDLLVSVHKLFSENEEARKRVQGYYDYVVADEFQDFTPIMRSILKIVVGDNKPLLAIGDEDQSIYGFRGADVNNALKFSKIFEGGEIYLMSTNRRCRKAIVEAASKVISSNSLRYDKNLEYVKEDGEVRLIPYNSEEGQLISIINDIEKMPVDDRADCVICYRENILSTQIAEKLEERGIAFNIISGYAPFSHELYRHVQDVLDILYDPMDNYSHLNLYKVLPIHRKDLYDVLGWDAAKKKFKSDDSRKHFLTVDFGKFSNQQTFLQELKTLAVISKMVVDQPLKSYFPKIFEMICKYFWNFKKQYSVNPNFDSIYTSKALEFFSSDKTYYELSNELNTKLQTFKRYNESKSGVTLSTFHGLKGLEFSKVYMTYLDDAIFPSIDSNSRNEEESIETQETETRLCFVAMTRAIDKLYMYYPARNPSYFIKMLQHKTNIEEEVVEDIIDIIGPSKDKDLMSSSESPGGLKKLDNFKSNFLSSVINKL